MKKKPNELFFQVFIGEVVSITTTIKSSETLQLEEETVQVDIPNTFDGYLLDVDDEYYYLGETSKEISKAVRKDQSISVEIAQVKTVFDSILDEMDEPEEKDIN